MSLRGEQSEGELKLGTITVSSLAAIVGKACSWNEALDRRMVAMSAGPSGFKLENNFISSPGTNARSFCSRRRITRRFYSTCENAPREWKRGERAERKKGRRKDGARVRLECERQFGRRIGRVGTNGSIN